MTSRKLAGAIVGMLSIVGLLIGLALIDIQILKQSEQLIMLAIAGITGLAGWQVTKQAQLDANGKNGG